MEYANPISIPVGRQIATVLGSQLPINSNKLVQFGGRFFVGIEIARFVVVIVGATECFAFEGLRLQYSTVQYISTATTVLNLYPI